MRAPASSVSGWHETSGCAIVKRMSAKRPRVAALADVPLGLLVGGRRRRADDVEPELLGEPLQLGSGHVRDCARVKAVRIHEDGGPEVLRYEDAPDPVPGTGRGPDRAAGGVAEPPRRLDPQGSPLRAEAAHPRRRRRRRRRLGRRLRARRPGRHQSRASSTATADHRRRRAHRRHARRADRRPGVEQSTRCPTRSTSRTAAAFPLVFETAYRMLVTKAQLQEDEWVLVWGIGERRRDGRARDREGARRARDRHVVERRQARARARARRRRAVNHDTDDVAAARQGAHRRRRARRRRARRRGDLEALARRCRAPAGRVCVCGATTGPNPPAQPPPHLVEAAHDLRLDDGHDARTSRASTSSSRRAAPCPWSTGCSRSPKRPPRTSGSRPGAARQDRPRSGCPCLAPERSMRRAAD